MIGITFITNMLNVHINTKYFVTPKNKLNLRHIIFYMINLNLEMNSTSIFFPSNFGANLNSLTHCGSRNQCYSYE